MVACLGEVYLATRCPAVYSIDLGAGVGFAVRRVVLPGGRAHLLGTSAFVAAVLAAIALVQDGTVGVMLVSVVQAGRHIDRIILRICY